LELERVLTKLKFDQDVSGYALVTNDGQPFLSFGLPDEVLPQIKGTLAIHAGSLKLMNVMTGQGTVVLARADPNWVLAVLFVPELNLGFALQRTKDVVDLMDRVNLPPPPEPVVQTFAPVIPAPEVPVSEPVEELVERDDLVIRHGCIIQKGQLYGEGLRTDSEIYLELKQNFSNLGMDILMMVDEKRTSTRIADTVGKDLDQVIEILQWCYNHHLVNAECPEGQDPGEREIVEVPLFEGDIDKVKKEHREVIELCNGTLTVHEIADQLGVLYFNALQCIIPYRGKTLKMIRKTKN
jgi:predicted regulator of Ras-like GTPase activity (Roadblock/LC7/MglB family)